MPLPDGRSRGEAGYGPDGKGCAGGPINHVASRTRAADTCGECLLQLRAAGDSSTPGSDNIDEGCAINPIVGWENGR